MIRNLVTILRYILILIGTFLFISPSVYTWYRSDYRRYQQMITAPYPFNHLGSAPFIIATFGIVELTAFILISFTYLLKKIEKYLPK